MLVGTVVTTVWRVIPLCVKLKSKSNSERVVLRLMLRKSSRYKAVAGSGQQAKVEPRTREASWNQGNKREAGTSTIQFFTSHEGTKILRRVRAKSIASGRASSTVRRHQRDSPKVEFFFFSGRDFASQTPPLRSFRRLGNLAPPAIVPGVYLRHGCSSDR